MKNIHGGKTVSLVVAVWMVLLITVCSTALGAENEKQTYEDLLDKYKGSHQEIITKLKIAKENSAEIVKLMQEMNRLGELMAKSVKKPEKRKEYQEKQDKLASSFFEKYGYVMVALSLHFPNVDIEKAPQKKIEAVLGEAISIYNNSLNCFDNNTYTGSKACESFRKSCVNYYGSENGDMYYYELTNELELKKVDVSDGDPRLQNVENLEEDSLKDTYQFCRLLSMTSSPFSPEQIAKTPMAYSFIEGFYGRGLFLPSIFQKECIDVKPSEQRVARLFNLKSQFPNEWIVKRYSGHYEIWQSSCDKAVQLLCENTYIIKDQIILTYETVACNQREVTKEDVESDIMGMDSHAGKLNHSTLLDSIDVCQKAHDNGFYWVYQKPALSKECMKETPKTKKKQK